MTVLFELSYALKKKLNKSVFICSEIIGMEGEEWYECYENYTNLRIGDIAMCTIKCLGLSPSDYIYWQKWLHVFCTFNCSVLKICLQSCARAPVSGLSVVIPSQFQLTWAPLPLQSSIMSLFTWKMLWINYWNTRKKIPKSTLLSSSVISEFICSCHPEPGTTYTNSNFMMTSNLLYSSFISVREGNHVMFREFTFVEATPHNRASFVRTFWKCFRNIGRKGGQWTCILCSSLLWLQYCCQL